MTRAKRTRSGSNKAARRRISGTLAGFMAIAVSIAASLSASPTNASWLDTEWDSSAVSTIDCGVNGTPFTTRASGKLLGGTIGGADLDNVAELDGISAVNATSGITVTPPLPESDDLTNNAFANPLNVKALAALNASLGNLLALPLDAPLGIVNSYAQVNTDSTSTGATGAINDSGGIQTTASQPAPNPPEFATLQLKNIVNTATTTAFSDVAANLADASLNVGAVASNATLDACAATWTGSIVGALQREYAVAGLELQLTSPTVETLLTETQGVVTGADDAVNALVGANGPLLPAVTTSVRSLVNGLLGTLKLGSLQVKNLDLEIDLDPVNALINNTISDDQGIVQVSLTSGVIAVDLDKLLHGANGVNDLPPNTQLLINDTVLNTLTAAITQALTNWVGNVATALTTAINTISVSLEVVVDLTVVLLVLPVPLARITLVIDKMSLDSLMNGTPIASTLSLLGNSCTGLLAAVCGLVNGLVSGLTSGLGAVVGGTVTTALAPTLEAVTSTGLPAIQTSTAPVITLVAAATEGLFGEDSVLSLTVNAQNSPVPANTNQQPAWALPGPNAVTGSSGQYDVAALRLTALGSTLQLDLARSSVGMNAPR